VTADHRSTWYLGPLADLALWQFGWVWLLVPLACSGDRHPRDYLGAWIALNVASFTHRQLTFPCVYLDRGVFARYPRRFVGAAIGVGAGFVGSVALARNTIPAGLVAGWPDAPIPGAVVLIGLGVVGAVWNGWHVLMQKHGLMRLYAARSGPSAPPLADRALLLGWLPLWLVAMIPLGEPLIRMYRPHAAGAYEPVAQLLAGAQWASGPAALLVAVTTVGWWLAERRANGCSCRPRLWMASSITLLGAAFFLFPPLKVYLALGFNHAIEYAGFVWGYERRRHAASADPLLGHLVRRPTLAVLTLVAPVAAVALALEFADDLWVGHPVRFGGLRAETWLYAWTVWSSFAHFWFDGFLWKLRDPAVRASALG
jgi:hypothetical protein